MLAVGRRSGSGWSKLVIAVLVVVAGVGCTDAGDDDEAAADGASAEVVADAASIVPDEVCRNNGRVIAGDRQWRITEDLPLEWRDRPQIDGSLESTADGDLFFVSGDERLAATENLTAPPVCVPWEGPQPSTDG